MKMSVFMINYCRKVKAFTNFTDARAQAIQMLKERKREGEQVVNFTEKVRPIDYDRSIHKITMSVLYKRRPWDNGGYWANKHYSVTIECYGEVCTAPPDPIFKIN